MDSFGDDGYVDSEIFKRMPWFDTPLDANRSCIRLIKLRRGTTDDPLICNFLVVSLKDKPAYDTLSYPWGDDNMTKTILVDNVTFEITVNLEEFLRCLRSPNADLVLWADALCIDQQNGREKSTQIGLMAQIYRQGKENHIWFGDFTHSWKDEILSDPLYVPTSQFTEVMWDRAEISCFRDLKLILEVNGVTPHSQPMSETSEEPSSGDLLLLALDTLDRVTSGKHLYEFPLFLNINTLGMGQIVMNRRWPTIVDSLRWIISRPWWSRVWTLQEAILPRVDSLVHIGSSSFRISRLLNGVSCVIDHRQSCCKNIGGIWMAEYQNFPFALWESVSAFGKIDKVL